MISLDEIYITKFDTLDEVLKDRLTTEIEQFVPGLTIMSIRVTKPIVPRAILNNYVEVEEQNETSVARETQQLVELTAATERKRLLIVANQTAEVQRVNLTMMLDLKRNQQEVSRIENSITAERTKSAADSKLYAVKLEAEGNRLLFTPELIQLEAVRAAANNTKWYFGDKIDHDGGHLFSSMSEY